MKKAIPKISGYLYKGTDAKTTAKYSKEFENTSVPILSPSKEKDWYIFVLSFLSLSKNGCDYILNSKRLSENYKFIIIAIIYNFKHGLESIVKAFSRSDNKKIDKSDHGHDIKKLFSNFKERVRVKNKIKLNKEIDKLEKIIIKYNNLDFLNNYVKDNFSVNDYENKFFKYPENSVEIVINYARFLSHVTKSDIEKIKKDIEEVIKISKSIKKILS